LRAHRLGVVFQQFFLLEHLTAMDNVATGLLYRGIPGAQRRRAAAAALDRVGLTHRAGHRARLLSGGERQRVAIARVFLRDAPILILDEATANLDAATEAEVVEEILSFARGKTVLVISHRPTALGLADRVIDLTAPPRPAGGGVSDA
jgi:putative ABC transport system ATP-binding protein